jgi:hypothetical protein
MLELLTLPKHLSPFSFDHCIVCPFSFDHCIVCPFSFDHCIVSPFSGYPFGISKRFLCSWARLLYGRNDVNFKRKLKQWWLTIPPISSTRNNRLSSNIIEHKIGHDIWRWKSRSWFGTGTKMRGVKLCRYYWKFYPILKWSSCFA